MTYNQRQIPKSTVMLKKAEQMNKQKEEQAKKKLSARQKIVYSDIVYGYLQAISEWDEIKGHPRYIKKKNVVFSRIATAVKLTRQTVSNRFKSFIDLGLVMDDKQNDRYILHIIDPKEGDLIPANTLNVLVYTTNVNVISTFNYLLYRWKACLKSGNIKYVVTYDQLKANLGMSTKTRSNDDAIKSILWLLRKIGLIEYDSNTFGVSTGCRTTYEITKVVAEIEEPEDEELKEEFRNRKKNGQVA